MLNLLAFWVGGMAAGIVAALGVLLFLRDFTLSVMRAVVSATSSPSSAYLQVAIGVLAVSLAALMLARFGARQRSAVPVTGGESAVLMLEPNTPTGSSRLSIRGRLEGGSLSVAFVAGLALATPPVEYMAAIIAIVASEPTAAAQVGAALMFTVVAFTVVEVPADYLSHVAGADARRRAAAERLDKRATPGHSRRCHRRNWFPTLGFRPGQDLTCASSADTPYTTSRSRASRSIRLAAVMSRSARAPDRDPT